MKTYDILLNPKAEKELQDLSSDTIERIKHGLRELSLSPKRRESGKDVVKSAGTSNPELYRLRIGEYRTIYWVDEEKKEVLVEKITTRKKAYKGLSDLP